MNCPLIDELIEAFCCLPGIGPKSAKRMAFHLLERDRNGAKSLAKKLVQTMDSVGHCQRCRNFSQTALCAVCQHKGRDQSLLCVVETPADVMAIEQAGGFRGLYFVLMGRLSPIDGIGPDDLGVDLYRERLQEAEIKEVIMATNLTVEGEATAYYFAELARGLGVACTRIARGIPQGGELEYLDPNTVSGALAQRQVLPA